MYHPPPMLRGHKPFNDLLEIFGHGHHTIPIVPLKPLYGRRLAIRWGTTISKVSQACLFLYFRSVGVGLSPAARVEATNEPDCRRPAAYLWDPVSRIPPDDGRHDSSVY